MAETKNLARKIPEINSEELDGLRQRFITELESLANQLGVGILGCAFGFHIAPPSPDEAYEIAFSSIVKGNACETQIAVEQLLRRIRRHNELE